MAESHLTGLLADSGEGAPAEVDPTDRVEPVLTYWTLRLARRISRFQLGGIPEYVVGREIEPAVGSMERLVSGL
jgi:hypothetical protein